MCVRVTRQRLLAGLGKPRAQATALSKIGVRPAASYPARALADAARKPQRYLGSACDRLLAAPGVG